MALPGITGLWQVEGRGQVTFEEMMHLDLRYVQQQSLWLDLRILAMTIPAVLRGEGAS
jgi:lipopolysaccharide/colanic/teichoic acid biosynthesis glycosyltransferase